MYLEYLSELEILGHDVWLLQVQHGETYEEVEVGGGQPSP